MECARKYGKFLSNHSILMAVCRVQSLHKQQRHFLMLAGESMA